MLNTFKLLITSTALLTAPVLLHAQAAASANASASAQAPQIVGSLPAMLTSAISSSSARVGQPLTAKLASPASLSDGTKLPAGSQLLGHITEVKSLSPQSGTSSLGMVFDRIKAPTGQQKQVFAVLKAIGGAARAGSKAAQNATQAGASSGGGLLGGLTGAASSTVDSTVGGVSNTTGSLLGTVTGLPGVLLNSAGTLNAQGRNIDLASGTSITVQSSATAGAAAGTTGGR